MSLRDLGRGLGRIVGTDLVTGTGTNEPRGFMVGAAAGAGSVTTGGSLIAPTMETLIGCQYGIVDGYRNQHTGWLMKDSTAGTLRKLRDGAGGTIGQFLWAPSLVAGQPDFLLGYPVFTDTNVATAGSDARIIAFADFSAYYIRQVGNPVIELDRSRYFDTDQTAVRAKHRVDGDLIDTAAVCTVLQNV